MTKNIWSPISMYLFVQVHILFISAECFKALFVIYTDTPLQYLLVSFVPVNIAEQLLISGKVISCSVSHQLGDSTKGFLHTEPVFCNFKRVACFQPSCHVFKKTKQKNNLLLCLSCLHAVSETFVSHCVFSEQVRFSFSFFFSHPSKQFRRLFDFSVYKP